MVDYFGILGVSRQANAAEVRQAYARLARERHPDRFPDPEQKARAQDFFKDLTAAFNTLSSEKARRAYEAELDRPKPMSPAEAASDAHQRGLPLLQTDPAQAIELLRVAVYHAPDQARYRAALARALSRSPQGAREAVQEAERAVQLAPSEGALHALLAELYLAQGLKLRAQRAAEVGLRVAPSHPEVLRIAALLGLREAGAS
jgi:curved DNA-binding protein CbpA